MIEDIKLDSWSEFKALIGRIVGEQHWGPDPERFWFRGHADASWTLTSSFDRLFAKVEPARKRTVHQTMLDTLRDRLEVSEDEGVIGIRRELRDQTTGLALNEIAALAQHYGTPTRMLDWSESAYIAAFFAFSDFSRMGQSIGDSRGDCAIIALDTLASAWNSETGVSLVIANRRTNSRLRHQRGVFTLNSSVSSCLEDYCDSFYGERESSERPLLRIVIPKSEAPKGLRDLAMMGITSESMFPGLDGAARFAFVTAVDRHIWRDT
jgi:FRG domain